MADKDVSKEANPQSDVFKAVAAASDAVLGAAVLTGLGAWGGLFLDEKLHASPWFAVTLGLLGAGLGLARMVKKALDAEKQDRVESGKASGRKRSSLPDSSDDPESDSFV